MESREKASLQHRLLEKRTRRTEKRAEASDRRDIDSGWMKESRAGIRGEKQHGLARRFHHGLLGPNSGLVVELVLFQQKKRARERARASRDEEDSDQEEKAI
ncbi:uncharacterized protein ARB_06314 [Trichophyton benhamiae CBS 112371]|uniref:Uncharacterized protein n=1 Tax=Arthroderma benhamiae (strain ATCC MYA-4681 / CBS 112371) TaxID=663331 RepID=D4AQ07_ARTBC|nr:uncharacterized protein ARB_06314 [Trichophyton benhamiae CBS 112371]EFE34551.1 hypothetical protein ARB_06314 [Trichophyton benhamiae CBS 112371]